MINFKGLFSSETSAIGLTSLGMQRKNYNQNSPATTSEKDLSTRLHESKALFSARSTHQTTQPKIQVQPQQTTEMRPLTPLFSTQNTLNFNNNTLLG